MQAIIPTAGTGKRLRPLTNTTPKSLIPVAGKPILVHIIDELIKYNIKDFVIILGYLGEKIKDYLTQKYQGITFHFTYQTEMKGSAHAILLAEKFIKEPVIIIYGDTIFQGDLTKALKTKADLVLGTKFVDDPRRFGVVEKDEQKKQIIKKLVEKPSYIKRSEVLVGVSIVNNYKLLFKSIKNIIKKDIKLNNEYYLTDAFQEMISNKAVGKTFLIDEWQDCGTIEALLKTNEVLLKKKQQFKTPVLKKDFIIIPPVVIGKNTTIKRSIIGPNISIGNEVIIEDSIITNSILSDSVILKEVSIKNSVLGSETKIKNKSGSFILGDNSEIN